MILFNAYMAPEGSSVCGRGRGRNSRLRKELQEREDGSVVRLDETSGARALSAKEAQLVDGIGTGTRGGGKELRDWG